MQMERSRRDLSGGRARVRGARPGRLGASRQQQGFKMTTITNLKADLEAEALEDSGCCLAPSLVASALLVSFAKPFVLRIISRSCSFGAAEQTAVVNYRRAAGGPGLHA